MVKEYYIEIERIVKEFHQIETNRLRNENISPSTSFQSVETNNYLATLYFSKVKSLTKDFIVASLCYIDLTTNHSYIVETTENDSKLNLEDIYTTFLSIRPKELVVFTDIT